MSAAVCGSKRSFFEDLPPSPPVSKKLRCSSSSSPVRLSVPSLIDQLRAVFPHMDDQVLERALQECGNDIDAAIKSLHELCLGSANKNSSAAEESEVDVEIGKVKDDNDASASASKTALNNLPSDGAEWVDLFVREMAGATSIDDAKARAARILEALEKSIYERTHVEATHVNQRENLMLKEQIEGLMKENNILKHAVKIQHERLADYDNKVLECQHLKQALSHSQEQLRSLEVKNYTLVMHLKQAQQCNTFPGHFPPDVF
ncbi:uncharacterized protein LOC114732203 isoform X2 [Neltuma alba]|uniref:uncharacterized protein LOC114724241 isoform X2 n=1 Tax=Neltuma alba TaxID=207710 RepID=UPI0010A4EA6C|nr:uncharacterized protein LOC114724241 isoform X2 [Prosopis alba]XP_028775338.1 uncharacterized protein LOC114732203 isoform X2 [Prosopis alba]